MEEKNSEKKERKMRDSGIPWIGEVPEGWGVNKIKYHLTRNEIKNKPDKQVLSVYRDYGVIPKDSRDDNHNVTSEDTSKYKYVQKSDLVINKMKAWQGSLGVSKYEGIVSPAYYIYKFHDDSFDGKFFHYLIRGCYKDEFRRISGGIREGQWDLSAEKFENTMIIIPPIPEQHRIADFLDSKCSEIDNLIENLRARVESAKEYKKAVITEAVTKGLDKDAKMKDSGVEWIGEIPEGWKIVQFKHIASIKSNLVQPDKYMKYPQIAPDNIEKDTGRLLSHQTVEESGIISGNHLFYRGQILYSKIRPNLNKLTVAPFDGLCSADMYPIESKLPTPFMVYSMLSTYFVSQVSLIIQDRVKMPKINQEELGEIKVVVPSQQEMLTIADYLDSKCSEIDALLQNYEDQITTLEEYKKSLIYEYVTGKKEVPAT